MAQGYKAFKGLDKPTKNHQSSDQKLSGAFGMVDYLVKDIESDSPTKFNKRSLEKLAKESFGVIDVREVKEVMELAIVKVSRKVALNDSLSTEEKFNTLVDNYTKQSTLALRTSTSIKLQQYSTPAPIAFLMGIYCGVDRSIVNSEKQWYLEPSAGNGILTIAGNASDFVVNEFDYLRLKHLKASGYEQALNLDSSKDLRKERQIADYIGGFNAVITNPPFEKLPYESYKEFGGYRIENLDHLMAIRALQVMKDNGKAAIIIGGHTSWDSKGRITAGKNLRFLSYLYKNYNVEDIILVNGDLYYKMGTSFNIRIILINGKKPEPSGYAPKESNTNINVVNSYEDLYSRFNESLGVESEIEYQLMRLKKLLNKK